MKATDDFGQSWKWTNVLPVFPFNFSLTQPLPFPFSHLPLSSLQITFLSDILCSDILSLKSNPIYLPVFHEQTYGFLYWGKEGNSSSPCVRQLACHHFPILESEGERIHSLFPNKHWKYEIKPERHHLQKVTRVSPSHSWNLSKNIRKKAGKDMIVLQLLWMIDCSQRTRGKKKHKSNKTKPGSIYLK